MWSRIGNNGRKFWGKKGAGIFFTDGKQVLLLKRSDKGDQDGTWGLPGGKAEDYETDIDTAMRESREECGEATGNRFGKMVDVDGHFRWTTFFFQVTHPFDCKLSNEHSEWKWVDLHQVEAMNLHSKFKENLDRYLGFVGKKISFREWLEEI